MKKGAVAGSLVTAAGIISILTLSSRVVGFARWFAQSAWVGTGEFANAYASANQIPNVAYEVAVGGALAGMTIPLISAPLARGRRDEADRVASVLATWALLILVPLAAIVWLAAPAIAAALPAPAGSDAAAQVSLISTFLRIFAVQIPLYGLCAVLTGVLQSHERFFWPALTPLLSSLGVIATYAAFGALARGGVNVGTVSEGAVAVLGWGTTLGVALLSLPLLIPVCRLGVRLRPAWRLNAEEARRALGLGTAGIVGLVAQQLCVLVVLWVARRYGGPGTLPVYQYSQAVYLLPYAIGAVPVATAMFPRLNRTVNDSRAFADATSRSSGLIVVLALAGAALVAVEAAPAQGVFGLINPVPGMREGLIAMACGLAGYALIYHLTRVLYALNRARAVIWATSAAWLATALLSLVFAAYSEGRVSREIATMTSLGTAQSIGMLLGAAGLAFAVHRAAPGALAGTVRIGGLSAVAAVCAVLAVWGSRAFLDLTLTSLWGVVADGLLAAIIVCAAFAPLLVRHVRRAPL